MENTTCVVRVRQCSECINWTNGVNAIPRPHQGNPTSKTRALLPTHHLPRKYSCTIVEPPKTITQQCLSRAPVPGPAAGRAAPARWRSPALQVCQRTRRLVRGKFTRLRMFATTQGHSRADTAQGLNWVTIRRCDGSRHRGTSSIDSRGFTGCREDGHFRRLDRVVHGLPRGEIEICHGLRCHRCVQGQL